ncbi:MAG TPA: hemerythrin domain-containing protein [Anaeromyxobacter sp.]|nr:hemerythrin domain-containing protein [Anaeromyxobacter sp.]
MMRHRAIAAIEDEHRSLGAVLHGLEFLVGEALARGRTPDLPLLRAMLHYIRAYPERLHHPAEDRTLFTRLRLRTREADSAIAQLAAEHAGGEARLSELAKALDRLEANLPGAAESLERQVRAYADFHWAHMRREEEEVLPVAQRVLTPEDWGAVHDAFAAHQAPAFGAADVADEFRQLFSRIVSMAPPPIGVGAER